MRQTLLSGSQINELIDQLAEKILSDYSDLSRLALIGIRTGGIDLAQRLQAQFNRRKKVLLPLGILDINLYRDDFDLGDRQPEVRESSIDFPLEGMTILLVDDVLFTGRTVRAALEAINDYGRPAAVRLAVLIDRGHRELPIQPDYTGQEVEITNRQRIIVTFSETGKEDKVERLDLPAK